MKSIFNLLIAFALFSTLISCGDSSKKNQPTAPLGRHNPLIKGVPNESVGHHITLKPDALEKPFLLTTTYTTIHLPFPRSLASKVISFKRRGSELFMFETLVGKSYASTTKNIILARFPIVSETPKGEITFNFETGMKLFYVKASFHLQGADAQESSYTLSQSYVESVHLKDSHIAIEHSIRIHEPSVGTIPLLLRYSLSNYNPSPNFATSELPDVHSTKVGYFQSAPVLAPTQSAPTVPIIKHDPGDFPITYYLSPNIPQPLMQSVADGILYWNRVLEREIFKIELLPDTIDPSAPGNHIVFWLENIEHINNLAGLADTTNDPLTGKILASRIFLPGHMINTFYQGVQGYIKTNGALAPSPREDTAPSITSDTTDTAQKKLIPRQHPHHCHKDFSLRHFQKIREQLNVVKKTSELNDMQIAMLSQQIAMDYLRSNVAHEIGHTLSLRHNFAASTQTDLNSSNYEEIIQNYIKTGQLPENFTIASSVMDYFPPIVDGLLGAHIRHNRPPLSYDRDAIRHLYMGEGNPLFFSSPYCSDEHISPQQSTGSLYQDCNKYDTFSNPTAWYHHQISEYTKHLPANIINQYQYLQQALATSPTAEKYDSIEFLQKYPLTPHVDAAYFNYLFERLSHSISHEAEFIQVKNKYFAVTGFNRDDYLEQTADFINQNVAGFGSISKLLFSYQAPPQEKTGVATLRLAADIEKKFKNLLQDASDNIAPDAMPANFDEQQEVIAKQIKKYLATFEKEFLLRNAQILKLKKFTLEDEFFAENLSLFVKRILFSKSHEIIESYDGIDFFSPRFEYTLQNPSHDLRNEILSLLTHDFYPQNPNYKKEIKKFAKTIFEFHQGEVKNILSRQNKIPAKLYNWFFFERQRFEQLKLTYHPTEKTSPTHVSTKEPTPQELSQEDTNENEEEELPSLGEEENTKEKEDGDTTTITIPTTEESPPPKKAM